MRFLHICVVYSGLDLKYKFSAGSQGLYYHLTRCASLRSPALSSHLHHYRKPSGEGQRDAELQVQSWEARSAVQMDQGCTRVWGVLLPDAEWVISSLQTRSSSSSPSPFFCSCVTSVCRETWVLILRTSSPCWQSSHTRWLISAWHADVFCRSLSASSHWCSCVMASSYTYFKSQQDDSHHTYLKLPSPSEITDHSALLSLQLRWDQKDRLKNAPVVLARPACVWFWRVIICSLGCSESTICFWTRLRLIDWILTDPLWSL